MIDEIKPVTKDWRFDRIRLGEKHLKYNLDDLVNIESFNTLRDVKISLDQRNSSEKMHEKDKDVREGTGGSQYDNLTVSKDKPHDIDKLI